MAISVIRFEPRATAASSVSLQVAYAAALEMAEYAERAGFHVAAVSEHASSDEEVVATVAHLINSGQVLLIGNFVGKDVRVG